MNASRTTGQVAQGAPASERRGARSRPARPVPGPARRARITFINSPA